MGSGLRTPSSVHGIDWSGASDAGRRIWIASAELREGQIRLTDLRRGEELPGSGRSRDECLSALRAWLREQKACVVGMDFPFGLPQDLVRESDWVGFLRCFPQRFPTPEAFRRWCLKAAEGRELKRVTDVEARTPFCPYNLRMYRQTYWGISALLAPLIGQRAAVAPPMQRPRAGVPWLLETCPASALKRAGLYAPYKGSAAKHRAQRAHILDGLITLQHLIPGSRSHRGRILQDTGGDALDAVIAASTTARAVAKGEVSRTLARGAYAVEAYVYNPDPAL